MEGCTISHSVNDGEENILSCGMQKKIWKNHFLAQEEIILSKATIFVNNIIIEEDFSKNGNRIKK